MSGNARLSVVTWRWPRPDGSHLFEVEYVNRLFGMVDRRLGLPFDFFCVTNDRHGLDHRIEAVPLPTLFEDPKLQASAECRCRRRLWQFDRARVEIFGSRALYLDLDLVLVDDITALVDRSDPLVCWRVGYAQCYSGALLLADAGALHGLWDAYRRDPEGYPAKTGQGRASDLAMLNLYLKTQAPPATWTEHDGIVTYFGKGYERHAHHGVCARRPTLPRGARVVMMGSADKAALDEGWFEWGREHWGPALERVPA